MTTRGRWTYDSDLAAWQLDGNSGWWLRRRTGATFSLRWCSYCWREPYSWWMLHRTDPAGWITDPPPQWYGPARRTEEHGHCTHRHLLADAMAAAERAYSEHIMKTLADL